MNAQDILDLIRDQSYQTTSNLPDATLIKYLNIVKNEFFSYLITAVDENYNWDYFNADTVVGQTEYTFPDVAYDTAGLIKVKEVLINYDWETYDNGNLIYKKARQINRSTLKYDWDYYVNNQNPDYPIFYVAERSIFIAPTPTVVTTNWIRMIGIRNIPDYTVSTTEADLRIPITYQHILIQWVLPYVYKRKGEIDKANFEQSEYIRKRSDIIKELSDRVISPTTMRLPDKIESTYELLTED